MIHTNDKVTNFFDLKGMPQEEQEEFFQDFGDLVMKKIFQKAWVELAGTQKQKFLDLLEASEANPEDAEKQDDILIFLDENVPNIEEYVAQEVAEIQATFTEYRDELLESAV
jgi:hypothetical protein